MTPMDTAVYALTPQGAVLARALAQGLDGDLFLPESLAADYGAIPFRRLMDAVADAFPRYRGLVFVAAAGIVVRAIAPHLRSKDRDPAVVVLDSDGRFAVSLLSGHLGGANDLARRTARITGGAPVITTATDSAGLESWDLIAARTGMVPANLRAVKTVNMAALRGDPVTVCDPEDRLGLRHGDHSGPPALLVEQADQLTEGRPSVLVTWRRPPDSLPSDCLVLHPRCLTAGVGCNRGTACEEILDLIRSVFQERGLALTSLSGLATIDAKRDEPGIQETAEALGVPIAFYPAEALGPIQVPTPSNTVKRHMGVESVCEAAAMKRAGGKRLLVPKVRSKNATLAVALEGSLSSVSAPGTPASWPPWPGRP